ncbi:DsbA family protein [Streptomyces aidingensis]|uniref:Protein-disulfide isomerase n=1 Tax=Streptomyces aidingensis TaxID=910347 RepID=A0A1I1EHT3_9ACTN|nr:thioredoxin domain-containing protein [Streptomyces aidingensis]SFB84540.1 Protein-disulfide isomerase [Streptomyces aidingensis]
MIGTNPKVLAGVVAALVTGALLLGMLAAALTGGGSGGAEAADGAGPDRETAGAGDPSALEPLPEDHPVHGLARRDAADPFALGDPDAPVVMLTYTDFQSALAARFARETEPGLVSDYVDAGVLRIEFRSFPVNGPESDLAARAAWAAGQQDRFWEFYRAAYAEDTHIGSGRFSREGVLAMAEEAQVPDLERFATDLDSAAAGEAVAADADEALLLGVSAVPTFLIDGHPLVGNRPAEEFRDHIEQLAGAASG